MSNNPERGKCKDLDTKRHLCNNPKYQNQPCMSDEKDSRFYGRCSDYRWED